MAPEFLNEIFQNRALLYNLRTNSNFSSRQVHSVYHGTESLSFLGPKIWELVPEDTKQSESLEIFKNKIKKFTFKMSLQAVLYLSPKHRFPLKKLLLQMKATEILSYYLTQFLFFFYLIIFMIVRFDVICKIFLRNLLNCT